MKYIVSWTLPQGTCSVAVVRFPGTCGAPPQGVDMLKCSHGSHGSHGMNGQGFAIAKPSNGTALFL